MLDFETLDTSANAVVISLGAVAFDAQNTTPLGDVYYCEIVKPRYQHEVFGRSISEETVAWWEKQSEQAQAVFECKISPTPFDAAILGFKKFCLDRSTNYLRVWGNGAAFDNAILASCLENLDEPALPHKSNLCYRTMCALPNAPERQQSGTHHNALDDAVSQALHLQQIYAHLRGGTLL